MKLAILATLILALPSSFAQAQQPSDTAKASTSNNLTAQDRTFVQKAAEDGMKEVQLGRLAEMKAMNAAVKDFAQMLVRDHTQANQELRQIAMKVGVQLPNPPDAKAPADTKSMPGYDALSKQSGAAFDEAYLRMQVEDHQKAIQLFEEEQKTGQNADLKAFAGKTLPTLRMHLQRAQTLQTQVKK